MVVAPTFHACALATPPPPRQTPSLPLQHQQPPFGFSHPLVYAVRVDDRVQALDRFVRGELAPKVLRLREEYECIEHQVRQRTIMNTNTTAATTTTTTKENSKRDSKERMKHQAWLYKRTSKKRELDRWESFLNLGTDLHKISNELNSNSLFLAALWQRSQSIAPREFAATEDSRDVVYDYNTTNNNDSNDNDNGDDSGHRRQCKQKDLLREYQHACMENIRLSKSVRERLDRMQGKENPFSSAASVAASTTSFLSSSNGETIPTSREEASILSSLMNFSNNFCVCSVCRGMFHRDYYQALIVQLPNNNQRELQSFQCRGGDTAITTVSTATTANKDTLSALSTTFICIHCWNTKTREERQERDDKALAQKHHHRQHQVDSKNLSMEKLRQSAKARKERNARSRKSFAANRVPLTSNVTSGGGDTNPSKDNAPHDQMTTAKRTATSKNKKNPLFESARWKARRRVMKDRLSAASSENYNAENSMPPATDAPFDERPTSPAVSKVGEETNATETTAATDAATTSATESSSSLKFQIVERQRLQRTNKTGSWNNLGSSISPSISTNATVEKADREAPLQNQPTGPQQAKFLCPKSRTTNRIAAIKLRMKSCAVLDSDSSNEEETEVVWKWNDCWSRFGSSASSICSNSIAESESLLSATSKDHAPFPPKRRVEIQQPQGSFVESRPSDHRTHSISESSYSCTSVGSATILDMTACSTESIGEKFIKSAMKTKTLLDSIVSIGGGQSSPTKVQDFPSATTTTTTTATTSVHKKKTVRFQVPLVEEGPVSFISTDSNSSAMLDTSTEIMDTTEYFCACDNLLSAF